VILADMAGSDAERAEYLALAHTFLRPPAQGEDEDPVQRAVRAYLAYTEADYTAAHTHANAALAAGISNPYLHLIKARLILLDAGGGGRDARRLDDPAMAVVLDQLRASLRLHPRLPEAFELLGEVLLGSGRPTPSGDLELLAEGAAEFPESRILRSQIELLRRRVPTAR
jgi:DNA-binding response OmpR family regulator